MSDEDITIHEKRVYGDREGATTAYVATEVGLARVDVSDDIVGEFSLARRGVTTDVAAGGGRLAVATPEDVLVGDEETFIETGFGPATAVGYGDDSRLVAAGEGRLARYDDGWETLAALEDVGAIDGDMVAAASGVHRLDGTHVGLEAACDVATSGRPLAATDTGLYYLANGWMRALDGQFRAVASDGETAHAASRESLYEADDDDWRPVSLPVDGTVADIAYGDATYAVTEDGTFLANAGDGWRHRTLGLPGVVGVAVP